MSRFKGLAGATRGFSSNYLKPGEYVVRLDACDFFDTDMKGNFWKNTMTVLGVIDGEHRVGEEVNTFFKESAGKSVFHSNLKGFIAGVTGASDEDVDDSHAEACLSENNPLAGAVFIVRGRQRVSKTKTDDKTGQPVSYTVYDWMQSMSPDEIREALDEETITRFFPSGLEG